jgi:hypothetical protein
LDEWPVNPSKESDERGGAVHPESVGSAAPVCGGRSPEDRHQCGRAVDETRGDRAEELALCWERISRGAICGADIAGGQLQPESVRALGLPTRLLLKAGQAILRRHPKRLAA